MGAAGGDRGGGGGGGGGAPYKEPGGGDASKGLSFPQSAPCVALRPLRRVGCRGGGVGRKRAAQVRGRIVAVERDVMCVSPEGAPTRRSWREGEPFWPRSESVVILVFVLSSVQMRTRATLSAEADARNSKPCADDDDVKVKEKVREWGIGAILSTSNPSGAPGVYLCTATLLLLSISVTGVAAAPATCLTGLEGSTIMSMSAQGAQFCSRYCFVCGKGNTACNDAEIAAGTVKLIYIPISDQASQDYIKALSKKSSFCDTSDCNTVDPNFCSTRTGSAVRTEAALLTALVSALVVSVHTVLL
jgi:hypothetical protein